MDSLGSPRPTLRTPALHTAYNGREVESSLNELWRWGERVGVGGDGDVLTLASDLSSVSSSAERRGSPVKSGLLVFTVHG